ncbi:hypothetical protein FIBSPDRAFT_902555 [Athelia psychrophila]|uniref:Uncharacterized protein n=1 Tax=Athelia psychrophila TaxID=1759441 RepID=A0A167X302_9AGAM|nr:hypothetical protein FIBSPDRAFT_902555 [Fibularhizoctonia sp. CBS 109695]
MVTRDWWRSKPTGSRIVPQSFQPPSLCISADSYRARPRARPGTSAAALHSARISTSTTKPKCAATSYPSSVVSVQSNPGEPQFPNTHLPFSITPSVQPSPTSYSFPTTNPEQNSPQPQQLVPPKGFVYEVLRWSQAICSKVPELVETEKNGTGEIDLTYRVVQSDLEAEEWRELALDSDMANFIYLDALLPWTHGTQIRCP